MSVESLISITLIRTSPSDIHHGLPSHRIWGSQTWRIDAEPDQVWVLSPVRRPSRSQFDLHPGPGLLCGLGVWSGHGSQVDTIRHSENCLPCLSALLWWSRLRRRAFRRWYSCQLARSCAAHYTYLTLVSNIRQLVSWFVTKSASREPALTHFGHS